MNFIEELKNAEQSFAPYAVVTVAESGGRGTVVPGKKMIILSDGTIRGTIGGGEFEFRALEKIRGMVAKGSNVTELIEFADAKLLVECHAPETTVVVMGAGHVGLAVIKAAKLLNFATILIDNRDESFTSEAQKYADKYIATKEISDAFDNNTMPEGAFYFSACWNHDLDKNATAAALKQGASYVGLVGSWQKINFISDQLREEGFTDEQLSKIYGPVGLDISGPSPEEIGFAVVAEILKIKNGGTGVHCRELTNRFVEGNCSL